MITIQELDLQDLFKIRDALNVLSAYGLEMPNTRAQVEGELQRIGEQDE